MKPLSFFLGLCLYVFTSTAQTDLASQVRKAEELVTSGNFRDGYNLLKQLEPQCKTGDTLYEYIIWYSCNAGTEIEKSFRSQEQFDSSLHYGLEVLGQLEKGKPIFNEAFGNRVYWMYKNIVVSYTGLGKLKEAQVYKDKLYAAYNEKKLPKGIDQYFNFHFFKWEGKNIWGYEWFEELPDNRMDRSFSKIVYYVYSTNADGTDKDQLYRLHVLMFHKGDNSVPFDYVLTKRLETAKNDVSGTLYDYTYKKEIDYPKLMNDIREVLKGNYKVGAQTVIPKKE